MVFKIFQSEDIDRLDSGHVVDFFPDSYSQISDRAVCLGRDSSPYLISDFFNLCFVARAKRNLFKIYEFSISRERLSPTEMGWLVIDYRTSFEYYPFTARTNPLLFYQ